MEDNKRIKAHPAHPMQIAWTTLTWKEVSGVEFVGDPSSPFAFKATPESIARLHAEIDARARLPAKPCRILSPNREFLHTVDLNPAIDEYAFMYAERQMVAHRVEGTDDFVVKVGL